MAHGSTQLFVTLMHEATRLAIELMIDTHKSVFMIGVVFEKWILEGMQGISNQLTSSAMGQVFMIGAFLDAQEQLERQLLLQQMTARAHKDYHPSMQMCTFGTAARGLASSAANAELVAFTLSQRSQDRQMHNTNSVGAAGDFVDKKNRVNLFIARYCDSYDNNNEDGQANDGLEPLCGAAKPGNDKWATNKDVEAGRLFHTPTHKARYDDSTKHRDDPDLFALQNNLYASNIMTPVPEILLGGDIYNNDVTSNQEILLDIRAIIAKRSVAEDSFNHIAGMRSLDTDDGSATSPYMSALLRTMGYTDDVAITIIDDYPSYNARMELLTKKIYMEPEFYTNLYDKPVNTARTGAAMRAIGLMQNMDMFKSKLRNEMALSVLLELEIEEEQENIDNRLKGLRAAE